MVKNPFDNKLKVTLSYGIQNDLKGSVLNYLKGFISEGVYSRDLIKRGGSFLKGIILKGIYSEGIFEGIFFGSFLMGLLFSKFLI